MNILIVCLREYGIYNGILVYPPLLTMVIKSINLVNELFVVIRF